MFLDLVLALNPIENIQIKQRQYYKAYDELVTYLPYSLMIACILLLLLIFLFPEYRVILVIILIFCIVGIVFLFIFKKRFLQFNIQLNHDNLNIFFDHLILEYSDQKQLIEIIKLCVLFPDDLYDYFAFLHKIYPEEKNIEQFMKQNMNFFLNPIQTLKDINIIVDPNIINQKMNLEIQSRNSLIMDQWIKDIR